MHVVHGYLSPRQGHRKGSLYLSPRQDSTILRLRRAIHPAMRSSNRKGGHAHSQTLKWDCSPVALVLCCVYTSCWHPLFSNVVLIFCLKSTHNLPPAEANEGERRFLGISCPPGRVPQTPAGELRPLHPLFMSGCQFLSLDVLFLSFVCVPIRARK